MRRLAVILSALLLSLVAVAQTTKVRGRVLDASDGRPVPFAAVFFVDSHVGTSTDDDGWFTLSTRDLSLTVLRASMISYDSCDIEVKPGVFTNIDIVIRPQKNLLSEITVKADNRRARKLLADIDAHRDRNNPENREGYSCDVYSKMELDLTHPREQLRGRVINRQWGFIFDYIDTSDVSGVPYLPVMFNESVSKRMHSLNPDVDREEITATRLSGADPTGNLAAQFTGSLHLRNNFYSQFINAFNVEIPSPINSSGLLFYNYYIIDSLMMDGRNTYHVRFHPKPAISTPAFDGEMFVDTQDWALRRVKAKMMKGQNINWVKDMVLEAEYVHVGDSLWFYKTDRFYADFALALRDSSQMVSFIGNRTLEFANPVFEKPEVNAGKSVATVDPDAGMKDDAYWDKARPYDLSDKEKDIYVMVDRVQQTNLYEGLYDFVATFINGYWDINYLGIGPVLNLLSYNPLEGFRMRFGLRTSPLFSKRDRFMVYAAFGVRDREFKGGATWEHLFRKEPTLKLTMDAHYDVVQLGRGVSIFNDGNILASIMGAGKSQKPCPETVASANLDWEITNNVNTSWYVGYREFHANDFVPMYTPRVDGLNALPVRSIPSAQARVAFRFSRDETVNRGHFNKKYLHSNYPVVTLSLTGGFSQLNVLPGHSFVPSLGYDQPFTTAIKPYFRPELTMAWKLRIPPVGVSTINLNGGTILGQVPYTMLHIHEGNGTYLLEKSSFSTMNFLEFASDSWVTFMLDHNFKGFFLGKIPYLKKLQLREVVSLKATWGDLRRINDGSTDESQAMLAFPYSMRPMGRIPYVEAGFGITNIFRLVRVDFIWRCTHRDRVTLPDGTLSAPPRNFVVNVGLEVEF